MGVISKRATDLSGVGVGRWGCAWEIRKRKHRLEQKLKHTKVTTYQTDIKMVKGIVRHGLHNDVIKYTYT